MLPKELALKLMLIWKEQLDCYETIISDRLRSIFYEGLHGLTENAGNTQ